MARTADMRELRAALVRINFDIVNKNADGVVDNAAIIDQLRREHAKKVAALADELLNRALTKLLNDVCGRRVSKSSSPLQRDLFLQSNKVPSVLPIRKGYKKDTMKFTIAELEEWIKGHDLRVRKDKNKGLKVILEWCKEHSKLEHETIGAIMQRMGQSGV